MITWASKRRQINKHWDRLSALSIWKELHSRQVSALFHDNSPIKSPLFNLPISTASPKWLNFLFQRGLIPNLFRGFVFGFSRTPSCTCLQRQREVYKQNSTKLRPRGLIVRGYYPSGALLILATYCILVSVEAHSHWSHWKKTQK